jgi:hypothetical protein
LNDDVAFWPRAAVTYAHDFITSMSSASTWGAEIDAPLVFRLGRYVVVSAGPRLEYVHYAGDPTDESLARHSSSLNLGVGARLGLVF